MSENADGRKRRFVSFSATRWCRGDTDVVRHKWVSFVLSPPSRAFLAYSRGMTISFWFVSDDAATVFGLLHMSCPFGGSRNLTKKI